MNKQLVLNELGNHQDVKAVTASSNLPGLLLPNEVLATSNDLDTIDAKQVFVHDHFLKNMEIELKWGESASLTTSTQNEERVLVNQQLIESFKTLIALWVIST